MFLKYVIALLGSAAHCLPEAPTYTHFAQECSIYCSAYSIPPIFWLLKLAPLKCFARLPSFGFINSIHILLAITIASLSLTIDIKRFRVLKEDRLLARIILKAIAILSQFLPIVPFLFIAPKFVSIFPLLFSIYNNLVYISSIILVISYFEYFELFIEYCTSEWSLRLCYIFVEICLIYSLHVSTSIEVTLLLSLIHIIKLLIELLYSQY